MKVVVVLSGGMDSAVMLWMYGCMGFEMKAISFNYGQRHSRELEAAKKLAGIAKVEHQIIDLQGVKPLLAGSSQTDPTVDVPEGHYAADNMKKTVVPNRNMIMLSIAAAWAISLGFDAVAFGAHAGDHTIYPDCREAFASALDDTFRLCDWKDMRLLAPFLRLTKGEICALGMNLGVPFQYTWTCYKGERVPCGSCGACQERAEAFQFARATDPITR